MATFVTVIHILTCLLIVIVVLMQSGKGADISATLGGSSNTVFGSSGGANFFTKTTFVLAAIFGITSLSLTIMGSRANRSLFDSAVPTSSIPAPKSDVDSSKSAPASAPAAATAPAANTSAPAEAPKK